MQDQQEDTSILMLKQDINPFLRGGLPGVARLKQVLTSIMAYHKLEHGTEEDIFQHQLQPLLEQAGLKTYVDSQSNIISFHIPESPFNHSC